MAWHIRAIAYMLSRVIIIMTGSILLQCIYSLLQSFPPNQGEGGKSPLRRSFVCMYISFTHQQPVHSRYWSNWRPHGTHALAECVLSTVSADDCPRSSVVYHIFRCTLSTRRCLHVCQHTLPSCYTRNITLVQLSLPSLGHTVYMETFSKSMDQFTIICGSL